MIVFLRAAQHSIVTARIRWLREGDGFSRICLFTSDGGSGPSVYTMGWTPLYQGSGQGPDASLRPSVSRDRELGGALAFY